MSLLRGDEKTAYARDVHPDWNFSIAGAAVAVVPAAPRFDAYSEYFDVAVPALATAGFLAATIPAIVLAQVRAVTATGRVLPAGPMDRAKGVMDALHDQRRSGPKYVELAVQPPLPDDGNRYISGLAVEVRPGSHNQTTYLLGQSLLANGSLIAGWNVERDAPNDIWADSREKERTAIARAAFARAVAANCPRDLPLVPRDAFLIVRHVPTRDEDNTWRTWLGALGGASWSRDAWGLNNPLASWRPRSMASLVEPALGSPVRYEVWLPDRA